MSARGQSLGRPIAVAGAGLAALLTLAVGLPAVALIGLSGAGGPAAATGADAAALDAWMAEKVPGSPLVGLGSVFVAEGTRNRIDPRALVAIAYHESVLGTAGSGAGIHNAFGWGPAIPFRSWQDNIATVARGLATATWPRAATPWPRSPPSGPRSAPPTTPWASTSTGWRP